MMESKIKEFNIVPDVISEINHHPKVNLKVIYENEIMVNGDPIPLSKTKTRPIVQIEGGDEDEYYALFMIDPDAPTALNPAFKLWRHWAVINIKGKDLQNSNEITSYQPPDPQPDSGLHRYTFLLYKQSKELKMKSLPEKGNQRGFFDMDLFAKENQLGSPIACTFFQCCEMDKSDSVRSDFNRVVVGQGIEEFSNISQA